MFNFLFQRNRLLFFISLSLLAACNTTDKSSMEIEIPANSIRITTQAMDFQMPDSIPSGWNTFYYANNSGETHFFVLEKYPEGKTIADGEKEVLPVFQEGMNYINASKMDSAMAAFGKLPEWFSKVVFMGGSGLVSPGMTSLTTLNLDPGYYVAECYVKASNGVFHSVMGMVKAVVVTETSSGNPLPKSDFQISISAEKGISIPDTIQEGVKTIATYFEDQKVHENFVGHDIHLVQLSDSSDIDELEKWMNWAEPEGLKTPAPKGVTFLGGMNDLPAGAIGYFTVAFKPGKYAFIAEVPNSLSKRMLKQFEIKE